MHFRKPGVVQPPRLMASSDAMYAAELNDVSRNCSDDFFVHTFKFLDTRCLREKTTVGTQKLHFARSNARR